MSLRLLLKLRKTHAGRVKIMLYIKSGSTEYACGNCEWTKFTTLSGRPRVLVCRRCGHQESVTSNTEFEGAKLSLKIIVDALIVYISKINISNSALARFLKTLPSTMLRLLEKIRRATANCVFTTIQEQNLHTVPIESPESDESRAVVEHDLQIVPMELFDSITGVRSIDSESVQSTMKTKAQSAIRRKCAQDWFDNLDDISRKPIASFIKDVKQIYHGISQRHAPGYAAEDCWRDNCAGSIDDLFQVLGRRKARNKPIFGGDFIILPAFRKGA